MDENELLHAQTMQEGLQSVMHTITDASERLTLKDYKRLLELAMWIAVAETYSGEQDAAIDELINFLS